MNLAPCYYCGRPANTAEHVPPKCIFPEAKDAFGENLRKDLITVPSCDEHNTAKSKDDEFLLASISAVVGNNGRAYIQTKTKLARACKRKDGLLKATVRNAKTASLVAPTGEVFSVLIGKPDLQRLERVLEHVARGLFYHEERRPFRGRCIILPGFVTFPQDSKLERIRQSAKLMFRLEGDSWQTRGSNPEVFHYQMGPLDEGKTPMVMTFFRGAEVFVVFAPD